MYSSCRRRPEFSFLIRKVFLGSGLHRKDENGINQCFPNLAKQKISIKRFCLLPNNT